MNLLRGKKKRGSEQRTRKVNAGVCTKQRNHDCKSTVFLAHLKCQGKPGSSRSMYEQELKNMNVLKEAATGAAQQEILNCNSTQQVPKNY